MAFWPFNRKKKKAEKLQEKYASSSATRDITRENPDQSSRSEPKQRRLRSLRRETKPSRAASPTLAPEPSIPEKSALRSRAPSTPQGTNLAAENPFDEKIAISEGTEEAKASSSRAPLTELQNPEAPPPAIFEHANSASQTSLQPENNFTVMPLNAEIPTLRPKRNGNTTDATRRKSSKRKPGTRDREQEIKAMTSPIPIPKRPQTYSSSPLARDTKKVPGGLNRHFERPTSEVSLPVVDSVRSSMSADSEWQHSYKISALDALSPRPTIKYAESPRQSLGSREYRASKASVRKDKAPAIPEEPFNARARMDDLADDLDAKTLRELMERDRRRKERKKKADQEKLQKKLQKKADKQTPGLGTKTAATIGGDVEMVDIQDTAGSSAQAPESGETAAQAADRQDAQSPSSWLQDPSKEHLPSSANDPFKDSIAEAHLDLTPDSEQASMKDDPIIETAKAVRLSTASLSPPLSPVQKQPIGPSGLSNVIPSPREDTPDPPSLPEQTYLQPPDLRRDSESSSRTEGNTWTSFFRRRGTKAQRKSPDPGRNTPSEFSNTSRESFARKQQGPPPVVQRSFRKGSTPQRTQSKFREDLPELPISPPRSRVQSPEVAQNPSPYIDDQSKFESMRDEGRVSTPIEDVHPAFREQISMNQPLQSHSPEGPASGMLSQSLASIDSEASWLSGRHPKRSSIPISSVRESQASLSQQLNEETEEQSEEPTFSRREINAGTVRGPGALSSQLRHLRTSSGGESNESDEGSIKYDTVKGRKPNIVQRTPYAKSREGLLEEFSNAEEISPVSPISPESPDSPEKEPTSVHRATSVDYGRKGHVRQLSAGSARLLDIPARTSTEAKRSSLTSSERARSPLSETHDEESVEVEAANPSPLNE